MTIVFDFDYTLYNTDRLKKAFRSITRRNGVPQDVHDGAVHGIRDEGPYRPQRHCDLMESYANCDRDTLERFFGVAVSQSCLYLYDDVIPTLERLRKDDHHLILLTFGDREFQRAKVEESGIAIYFDDVLYTEGEKHQELALPEEEEFMFINDNDEENRLIQQNYPNARVLRIVRSNRENKEGQSQAVIHSLNDLFTQNRL